MSDSFDLPAVERLTVGTIGEPGQRVFYVQARSGSDLVTFKVEKAQMAALAVQLGKHLQANPPEGSVPNPDELELEEPVEPQWPVMQMGLSFAADADAVLLLFEEMPREEDEEPSGAIARIGCSRAQAAALAMRAAILVASGRPPCPLCGFPLDPRDHLCPRTNGHRPPL